MARTKKNESDSIVDYMVDPISSSCDINIIELTACFRASTIVLTNELHESPPPALVVQFAVVAAINGLKSEIRRVH